jgi:predicted lysophospholipase L1 biosynthesis ABC-type transport system permease subunit
VVSLHLAATQVRRRPAGFLASFLATGLGATILMAFASLLDVAAGGVDAASGEILTTMASVAGGWCLLIVVFAVASTLTLTVSQRAEELALLKNLGATPRQLRRLVTGEALVVALAAAAVAVLPGWLLGRLLLELLIGTEQVAAGTAFRFGVFALSIGVGVTLVGATLAAFLTARRTARMRARAALTDASAGTRIGWVRLLAAVFCLVPAVSLAVVTATVMSGEDSDAMQTAGQASIYASIALALLAPAFVPAVTALFRPLLRRGAAGWLAEQNLRSRARHHASAMIPVVLFTGISSATIAMQLMENGAMRRTGAVPTDIERTIETLNLVVVGMIALFAAIMLVNTLVAAVTHRRRELAQQRLAGATPEQARASVALECLVLAVTGAGLGLVASTATVIPYGLARADATFADIGAVAYPAVAGAAVLVTLLTGTTTATRIVRTPATSAVSTV